MNPLHATLRDILHAQDVAALGTLHEGAPYVSMTPFAWLPDGSAFAIHVSALAAHTKDMLRDARVSLLVIAPAQADVMALARPRVTIQGEAGLCPEGAADYVAARTAYLARFPQSADLFGFGDFSLWLIRPVSLRLVAGFAQARTLTPEVLAEALRATS